MNKLIDGQEPDETQKGTAELPESPDADSSSGKPTGAPTQLRDRGTSMSKFQIGFKKERPDAILPKTYSEQAAGFDIYACLISDTGREISMLLPPRTTRNIPTGLLIEAPAGFAVLVLSRSGLAAKSIFVANAPGLVDPDYRGELRVLLYNGGHESEYIKHGQRIAQLMLFPIVPTTIVELKELTKTARGDNGFGSTGA